MLNRRSTRLACLGAAAFATLALVAPASASSYSLICKHGKYDIDGRSQEQLKSAFGTSFCTIRSFGFRSDAENFSRNNNMQPGKSCSCR